MQLRLYGVTFILAGIIMLIITLVQWLKLLSFRKSPVTLATVTGVDKANHYSNNRSRTSYSLSLTYTVDGIAYQRSIPCDASDYKQGADRQVEIRYKARNPKRVILNAPDAQQRGQRILWTITLALFAIGAVMLVLGGR